jgi:hypothetical protein
VEVDQLADSCSTLAGSLETSAKGEGGNFAGPYAVLRAMTPTLLQHFESVVALCERLTETPMKVDLSPRGSRYEW